MKKQSKHLRESRYQRGTSKSHGKHRKNDLPTESRPIAQVPSKSYIGMALKNIGRRTHPGDSSDGPSSDSSSSDSSDESDPSSSSDDESHTSQDLSSARSRRRASKRPRSRAHSKKRKHDKTKSRRSGHSKAIKPNEYDGAADARAYHRFIKESSAYIEDSGISRKRQCFALSYFLTDKAYDFYQQKVSMTEEKWTLEEFYTELFNFCFPINYRMQMRKKLNHTFQKDKTVNQYAFELEEIYNMIGGYSQQDKVIKLWNGFRRSIQAALWNDKLNPEISSWRKVLAAAEIIEIAESINGPSKEGKTDLYSGSYLPSNRWRKYQENSQNDSKETSLEESSDDALEDQFISSSTRKDLNPRYPSRDSRSQSSRGREGHPRFGSTPHREFIKKEPVNYGLPDREKATQLAEGRCFGCNEIGHLARNCPEGNSVKHTGNKSPGVSNFNMEFIEEDSSFDSNPDDVLNSLPLGHITFENWEESDSSLSPELRQPSRPSWMRLNELKPQKQMGDAPTLQNMEQHDSQNISDSETSEFSGRENVLAIILDMFDQELDKDVDQSPELQSVPNIDSDSESNAAPEGGSYVNSHPLLANLETKSSKTGSASLDPGINCDLETTSDSGSSLGDQSGYDHGKLEDILAWKVQQVLTRCQPFPDDEIEGLPMESLNGKPRFEVTRGEESPDNNMYTISDHARGRFASIHVARLRDNTFSIGKWYAEICAKQEGDDRPSVVRNWMQRRQYHETIMGAVREQYTADILEMAFASEDNDINCMDKRFDVEIDCHDITHLVIYDRFRRVVTSLPQEYVENPNFDLVNWYEVRLARLELDQFNFTEEKIQDIATDELGPPRIRDMINKTSYSCIDDFESGNLEVNAAHVARDDKYPAVQRNAASVKDKTRILPKPVTLTVKIDGHPARALIDSGSLGDFMSTNLADQLNVKREELEAPLGLQLGFKDHARRSTFEHDVSSSTKILMKNVSLTS